MSFSYWDWQAEARLAARRQARAEAREIRMKELEKQQKESEENADRQYDMYSSGNKLHNLSTPVWLIIFIKGISYLILH